MLRGPWRIRPLVPHGLKLRAQSLLAPRSAHRADQARPRRPPSRSSSRCPPRRMTSTRVGSVSPMRNPTSAMCFGPAIACVLLRSHRLRRPLYPHNLLCLRLLCLRARPRHLENPSRLSSLLTRSKVRVKGPRPKSPLKRGPESGSPLRDPRPTLNIRARLLFMPRALRPPRMRRRADRAGSCPR